MGVATLSGFTPYFLERIITVHIMPPNKRDAREAVISELAHIKNAWWMLNWSLGTHRNITAAIDARAATIRACAYIKW